MLHNQRGFTLIEALLAITLTGLLMAGLFGLLSTSLKSWQQGRSGLEVQQTVRTAVDFMARDIAFAQKVVISPNGSTLTIETQKYVDISKTPNKVDTIIYSVDTSTAPWKLYRTLPGGTPQPMTGESSNQVSVVNPANGFAAPFGASPAVFNLVNSKTVEINLAAVDYNAYAAQPAAGAAQWNAYRMNTAVRALNIP